MADLLSQSQIINLVFFIFLLGCKLSCLHACPLPPTEVCNDCDVLNYISSSHTNQSTISPTVIINLQQSINNPTDFARFIHSNDNEDFSFDATNLSPSRCLPTQRETGTPCTQSVVMVGENHPTCTWNYTCNYSPNRFPQYIWKAQCATAPDGYRIHAINYLIPILKLESEVGADCLPFQGANTVYRWGIEEVPVACVCVAMN